MEHIGMAVYGWDGEVMGYTRQPVSKSGKRTLLGQDGIHPKGDGRSVIAEDATIAERIFKQYGREQAAPVAAAPRQAVRWQDQPATDRQLEYLSDLGVKTEPGMTKGRASELIDAAKGGDGVEYLGGQYAEGMQSIGEVY
jgi:hypothetical protein